MNDIPLMAVNSILAGKDADDAADMLLEDESSSVPMKNMKMDEDSKLVITTDLGTITIVHRGEDVTSAGGHSLLVLVERVDESKMEVEPAGKTCLTKIYSRLD